MVCLCCSVPELAHSELQFNAAARASAALQARHTHSTQVMPGCLVACAHWWFSEHPACFNQGQRGTLCVEAWHGMLHREQMGFRQSISTIV